MTPTVTLATTVHSDPSSFAHPAWETLRARDPDRHLFSTPEWHRMWWEEFGDGKELLVLEMSEGDEVVGMVPLYRKLEGSRRMLRFVGGIDLTDYLGPICAPEDRPRIAHGLISWLSDQDDWDELDAHNLPVPQHFAELLAERADVSRFELRLDQEETAALLRLPGDWDAYLASLDSKERHELKRKRRRIARDHPDTRMRTSSPDSLDADLKIFVDMHRGAEGMKGHFMRPEIATFFERIARGFSGNGLRIDFLEVGDSAVATTFGFEMGSRFYLYNSAYEPDAKRLSPGLILVSMLIEEYIGKGYEVFDFLRGPERYKYQLGAEAVPLNNVRILRS